MDIHQEKMEKKDKLKIIIFVIAIIVPFGVCALIAFYLIRYYIFGKKFTHELNLIKKLGKKIDQFIDKLLEW